MWLKSCPLNIYKHHNLFISTKVIRKFINYPFPIFLLDLYISLHSKPNNFFALHRSIHRFIWGHYGVLRMWRQTTKYCGCTGHCELMPRISTNNSSNYNNNNTTNYNSNKNILASLVTRSTQRMWLAYDFIEHNKG